MEFTASGKIKLGKEFRVFSIIVDAKSENAAKHKTYSLFGSHNGLKRSKVIIEKVEKG